MKILYQHPIILLLSFFLVHSNSFSQETLEMYEKRKLEMQQEELKIQVFISLHIGKELPAHELKKFKRSLTSNEDSHEHGHQIDEKKSLYSFKRAYWRNQYFDRYPKAISVYSPRIVAGSCANGDFETGTFAGFTGAFAYDTDGYSSGDCTITTSDFTFTPVSLALADVSDFDIMSVGTDPFVISGTLNKVCSGLYSARINSDLDAPGYTRPENSVSRLSKKVVLSVDNETIYFKYALVMIDPSGHLNQKPTFKARILDNNQNECDWLCTAADTANPFLLFSGSGSTRYPIVYKQWECANIQACGVAGDTVEIEFLMTDCGAGGHWGYAYIDDICDTCQIDTCNTTGSIQLNPTDTCVGDTMLVCGTYDLAAVQCSTATVDSISLYLYQNGIQVAGPFTIYSPTGGTFCFTIDPSMLPPGTTLGEGFDFYTEIYFNHGGGSYSIQNNIHSNPGLNNDYVYGADCCPEFDLKTCCDLLDSTASRSAIDPVVQSIITQYRTGMASRKTARDTSSQDPCCDPCNFPNDSFPVFILDENNIMIDASAYTITWSHDSTNTGSFGFIFPNQQTIVTVTGPDSCIWQDTFLVVCCSDTISINSFCPWDPCNYPSIPIPLNVTDQHGNILSPPRYTFSWSNGSTGNTTSESQENLPISVIVHDSLTGCDYFDTLTIDCCSVDTPQNLNCQLTSVGTTLTWDPVPGAVSYILYRIFNDPECCQSSTPPSSAMPVTLTGTSYTIYGSTPCFSWRVVAICANGDTSAFSKKHCCGNSSSCVITAPVNLNCRISGNMKVLSWDLVPLAVNYEIELTYNDPTCCTGGIPSSMRYTVATTSYSIPNNPCTSWKVRAICADGTKSAWSNGGCRCTTNLSRSTNKTSLLLNPNPAQNIVYITFESRDNIEESELMILDVSGRKAYGSTISSNQPKKVELHDLHPGLYICVIKKEGEIIETSKLIVR